MSYRNKLVARLTEYHKNEVISSEHFVKIIQILSRQNGGLNLSQLSINPKLSLLLKQCTNSIYDPAYYPRIENLLNKGLCAGFSGLWMASKFISYANKDGLTNDDYHNLNDMYWFSCNLLLLAVWDGITQLTNAEKDLLTNFFDQLLYLAAPNILQKGAQGDLDIYLNDINHQKRYQHNYSIALPLNKHQLLELLNNNHFTQEGTGLLIQHRGHAFALMKINGYFCLHDSVNPSGEIIHKESEFIANMFFKHLPRTAVLGFRIYGMTNEPYLAYPKKTDLLNYYASRKICKRNAARHLELLSIACTNNCIESYRHYRSLDLINTPIAEKEYANGQTLLSLSANWGRTQMIDLLLKDNANLNQIASYATNPLSNAVALNRVQAVKKLLDVADPNFVDIVGFTPLINAAYLSNNEEIIQALLSAGANPYWVTSAGTSALCMAAKRNNIAAIKTLINYDQAQIACNLRETNQIKIYRSHAVLVAIQNNAYQALAMLIGNTALLPKDFLAKLITDDRVSFNAVKVIFNVHPQLRNQFNWVTLATQPMSNDRRNFLIQYLKRDYLSTSLFPSPKEASNDANYQQRKIIGKPN